MTDAEKYRLSAEIFSPETAAKTEAFGRVAMTAALLVNAALRRREPIPRQLFVDRPKFDAARAFCKMCGLSDDMTFSGIAVLPWDGI